MNSYKYFDVLKHCFTDWMFTFKNGNFMLKLNLLFYIPRMICHTIHKVYVHNKLLKELKK